MEIELSLFGDWTVTSVEIELSLFGDWTVTVWRLNFHCLGIGLSLCGD